MPPKQFQVLVFVCLVIFLDALGVGLILPVMPDLIAHLTNLPNSRAAEITGYLMFAFAGAQFFLAPVLPMIKEMGRLRWVATGRETGGYPAGSVFLIAGPMMSMRSVEMPPA